MLVRQGMRGKGKDGEGSIPIDWAGYRVRWPQKGNVDGLQWRHWAGLAGQYAARATRGLTWRETARRLGSLVGGSGADGAVRPGEEGLAIERGRD